MKKLYNEPKVRIEFPADVVTTSLEVETGRVPFFSTAETIEGMPYISTRTRTKNGARHKRKERANRAKTAQNVLSFPFL